MKVKIGNDTTNVEIEEKFGLKFLHLPDAEGIIIRFAGTNVAYIGPYYLDWIEDTDRYTIYHELLSQIGSGACSYPGPEKKMYKKYLKECFDEDKELDPEYFRKKITKMHLMEDLK